MSKQFLLEERVPVTVPAILADAVDFKTGELLSISRGYDPTDGAVFTALRTVRASGSAVEDVGQKFHEHKLVDTKLEPFMKQEVAFALKHLTDSNQVELQSVDIASDADYGEPQIRYFNRAQQQDRTATARTQEIVGGP